jgi:hypothetical protein
MPIPNAIPLSTFLRMLRIALGYGSRSERIQRMLHSTSPDVAILAHSLKTHGFIDQETGTVKQPMPWTK